MTSVSTVAAVVAAAGKGGCHFCQVMTCVATSEAVAVVEDTTAKILAARAIRMAA